MFMRTMAVTLTIAVVMTGVANADVFNMPDGRISLETVPVGSLGNAPYPETTIGAVDYEYRIGMYEVTAAQYCQFLNAIADDDPYEVYRPEMANIGEGLWNCGIIRSGVSGAYSYSIAPDRADRPVDCVDWGCAARFANWLHNGQPIGAQGPATTEEGSYSLNGAMEADLLMAVTRNEQATWVLPSEDEWVKAAYHANNGATASYWQYPTASSIMPSNDWTGSDPGNTVNYRYAAEDWTIDAPYFKTAVGTFANSASAYGTFDQGGNVWEWTEGLLSASSRCIRGGAYYNRSYTLGPYWRVPCSPAGSVAALGFRVCRVGEPTVLPGDADRNGRVDLNDFVYLKHYFGTGSTWAEGDFDADGDVDLDDFVILKNNFGATANP